MNKFDKLYNVIMESISFPKRGDGIPRPERLKTPPNFYGNTGRNARELGYYVQDEAESIFQNKYGDERGHKLWAGIIEKGNAMFTACDQILGEMRSMADINTDFIKAHPELNINADDVFMNTSWLFQWTIWILVQIAEGKQFTHNFISTCIPTFKYYLDHKPEIFKPLLDLVGIDPNNFVLSKKIQTKIDLEKAEQEARERLEQERKQKEEAARLEKELAAKTKNEKNEKLVAEIGDKLGQFWADFFTRSYDRSKTRPEHYVEDYLNLNVGIDNLITLPEPTNKDEERIYSIIQKAGTGLTGGSSMNASLKMIDSDDKLMKAARLASQMNSKITDEIKRVKRKEACEKYGLIFLAKRFE